MSEATSVRGMTPVTPTVAPNRVPFSKENALASGYEANPGTFPGHPLILPGLSEDDYITQQLDFSRIDDMANWLWFAGWPYTIRPLHRQKTMQREILITDNPQLHLVWRKSIIYIKPLPLFILDHAFFEKRISSSDSGLPSQTYGATLGFLLSYAKLIQCEADLGIAKGLGLLPNTCNITWEMWSRFARDVYENVPELGLEGRWRYGELQSLRINSVYRLRHLTLKRYLPWDKTYRTALNDYFGWLLVVFVYLTVVLTSMQVVLALSPQYVTEDFRRASFGFSVFCLVTCGAALLGIGFTSGGYLLWRLSKNYRKEMDLRQQREEFRRGNPLYSGI
ncbi:hypothetical protein FGG08_000550 [Glutinoglossum americanum]|uniref:Uncharacterized protein n=1 Tax=Glutinoglossum americanum TaxID=1670608 RepID=A0A9P8I8Z6_9PEZI|nr:hypothetical protein FGG08_000550 [Glutinoglossum americanum]